jgi:hypothetical protein
LLYIPRDSNNLDDITPWSEPFSRELADKAADFHDQMREMAATAQASAEPLDLNGLRDEPPSFCEAFCSYVDTCRGPERAITPDDPDLIDLAQRFMTAKIEADEAYARVRYYKELLDKAPPMIVDGYKLAWSGGRPKSEQAVDLDELKAAFEMLIGPLPMTTVETFTARSFRMTKARKAS